MYYIRTVYKHTVFTAYLYKLFLDMHGCKSIKNV